MKRAALVLFAFAIGAPAQVTVTPQGFATISGPAIPATPVSPPILYAPIVRLDQGQTRPLDANAANAGILPVVPAPPAAVETGATGEESAIQNQAAVTGEGQPFNFGAAQFPTRPGTEAMNGTSLGQMARELQQQKQNINTRTFTNSDIQKMDQQPGGMAISTAAHKKSNNNWVPNNGVLTPRPDQNSAPGAVAAPAPQQQQSQPSSPFTPKTESNSDQNNTPPQAENMPSAERPLELAENRPPEIGAQQPGSGSEQQSAQTSQQQLPQTATRLPLIGVLGLVSISTGLFVRYQRAKSKKP